MPEFDVVLSGHTHERTYQPIRVGRTVVVEPGLMASFLGRLDLTLAPGGGVADCRFRLIPVRASDFPEDPAVKRLVDAALDGYPRGGTVADRAEAARPYRERMDAVRGYSRTTLQRYDVVESNVDELVTDIVRDTAKADVAFSNGFRFSPPVPAGPVTEGDLWNLMPLDERLKVGWVTGRQLRAYLEHELTDAFTRDPQGPSGGWGPRFSGMTIAYVAGGPDGHRLRSAEVGGRPLDDDARYTMASCEPEGATIDVLCRLHGAHDVRVLPVMLHQAMDDYFGAPPQIAPAVDGRSMALDLPGRSFSQAAVDMPALRPPKHSLVRP